MRTAFNYVRTCFWPQQADNTTTTRAPTEIFSSDSASDAQSSEADDSPPRSGPGSNQSILDEKIYWLRRYELGSAERPMGLSDQEYAACQLFRTRWDAVTKHLRKVLALQAQGNLSAERFRHLLLAISTRAAVAFGWIDENTGQWTEAFKQTYKEAGAAYGWGSWFYNLVAQLPRILMAALNLAIEIHIIRHPEDECELRVTKSVFNMTYAFVQMILLYLTNKWNGTTQSASVVDVAITTSRHYIPAQTTQKRFDKEGNKVVLGSVKHAKYDEQLVERLERIIRRGRDVRAAITSLEKRKGNIDAKIAHFEAKQKTRKLSAAESGDLKRLQRHADLLKKLHQIAVACRDGGSCDNVEQAEPYLEAIKVLLTGVRKELVISGLFSEAVVTWWSGQAKGFWRNSFNVAYAVSTLVDSIHHWKTLADAEAADLLCPGPGHNSRRVWIETLNFVLVALQPLSYTFAVKEFFGNDLRDKQLALLSAHFATRETAGTKLEEILKGPCAVRVEQMASIWKGDRLEKLMILAHWFFPGPTLPFEGWRANLIESVELDEHGAVTRDHSGLIALFLKTLDDSARPVEERIHEFQKVVKKLIVACNLGLVATEIVDQVQSRCVDHVRQLDWLETNNIEAFIACDRVPELTRRMFRLALESASGARSALHRRADRWLANRAGEVESESYRGHRLQVGHKGMLSFPYGALGNGWPLLVASGVSFASELLHLTFGHGDIHVERAIAKIKVTAATVSTIAGVGSVATPFGSDKLTAVKNRLRDETNGIPDVANAGLGVDSFFNVVTIFWAIASEEIPPELQRKMDYPFHSEGSLFSVIRRQLFALDLHLLDPHPGSTIKRLWKFMTWRQAKITFMSDADLRAEIDQAFGDVRLPVGTGNDDDEPPMRRDPYAEPLPPETPESRTVTTVVPHASVMRRREASTREDKDLQYLDRFHRSESSVWVMQRWNTSRIYYRRTPFTDKRGRLVGRGYELCRQSDVSNCRKRGETVGRSMLIQSYWKPGSTRYLFRQREVGANCTLAVFNMLRVLHDHRETHNECLDRLATVEDMTRFLTMKNPDGTAPESNFHVEAVVDFHNHFALEGTPKLVAMSFASDGKPRSVGNERFGTKHRPWLGQARHDLQELGICFQFKRKRLDPAGHTVLIRRDTDDGFLYLVDPSRPSAGLADRVGDPGQHIFSAAQRLYAALGHRFENEDRNCYEVFFFEPPARERADDGNLGRPAARDNSSSESRST